MKRLASFLSVAGMAAVLFSCQSEDVVPDTEKSVGRVVLSMSEAKPFVEVSTRAEQALTDLFGYTFLLKGEGMDDMEVTFSEEGGVYSSIIPAGTYTLSADNRAAAVVGNGTAYYSGTSSAFTLGAGESVTVSINLGSPQNAEVKLCVDGTFSDLYDITEVTFNDGTGRTVKLDNSGTVYLMIPTDGKAKFNIKATAKAGSHVTDLPADGLGGSLSVEAGKTYTLNLTAKAIADMLIEIGEGEHKGEFNAPRYLEALEPLGSLELLESLESPENPRLP